MGPQVVRWCCGSTTMPSWRTRRISERSPTSPVYWQRSLPNHVEGRKTRRAQDGIFGSYRRASQRTDRRSLPPVLFCRGIGSGNTCAVGDTQQITPLKRSSGDRNGQRSHLGSIGTRYKCRGCTPEAMLVHCVRSGRPPGNLGLPSMRHTLCASRTDAQPSGSGGVGGNVQL